MKSSAFLGISMVVVIAGGMALAGCSKSDTPAAKSESAAAKGTEAEGASAGAKDEHGKEEGHLKLSAQEKETAGLKVEELVAQPVADQVTLTATIKANQDRIAHVAPRVSARLVKVMANLGDKVRGGQSMAQLDSLELGEAHSVYQQARSQLALATADYERAQKLKADDIIPDKEFLRTRSEFEKAKASQRAALDRLRLLDSGHSEGEQGAPSEFPLRAPFAGTVIEKNAVLGELAQPDKSLFTVADLSNLWIEANLFEKDLSRVRVGAPAIVTVSAYPGEEFRGKLTYISNTVDKETRAVVARVEVPNVDGRLKPEMFATASIDTGTSAKALAIPQEAVLMLNGQPTVFVVEGDAFEARPIETGPKAGNRVLLKSGIKEGEQVVTRGAYVLKAKMLKSQIGDSH